MEDIFILLIASAFLILGFIGSILPILPGPIISYIGLIFVHFFTSFKFSQSEIVFYTILTGIVFFSDYILQFIGVKKLGGEKYAMYGTIFGIIVGIFFAPIGLVLGPFLGALLGALKDNKAEGQAIGIAMGALIGFLFGTLLKIIFSLYILYIVINKLLIF